MKKILVVTILILSVMLLAACGQAVRIGSFSSRIIESQGYQDAVDQLLLDFKAFAGCTLEEIRYAGDETVLAEAEIRGYSPEKIIVLETTFTTDDSTQTSLEPHMLYENYQFTYVRDFVGGMWTQLDHGYC